MIYAKCPNLNCNYQFILDNEIAPPKIKVVVDLTSLASRIWVEIFFVCPKCNMGATRRYGGVFEERREE